MRGSDGAGDGMIGGATRNRAKGGRRLKRVSGEGRAFNQVLGGTIK